MAETTSAFLLLHAGTPALNAGAESNVLPSHRTQHLSTRQFDALFHGETFHTRIWSWTGSGPGELELEATSGRTSRADRGRPGETGPIVSSTSKAEPEDRHGRQRTSTEDRLDDAGVDDLVAVDFVFAGRRLRIAGIIVGSVDRAECIDRGRLEGNAVCLTVGVDDLDLPDPEEVYRTRTGIRVARRAVVQVEAIAVFQGGDSTTGVFTTPSLASGLAAGIGIAEAAVPAEGSVPSPTVRFAQGEAGPGRKAARPENGRRTRIRGTTRVISLVVSALTRTTRAGRHEAGSTIEATRSRSRTGVGVTGSTVTLVRTERRTNLGALDEAADRGRTARARFRTSSTGVRIAIGSIALVISGRCGAGSLRENLAEGQDTARTFRRTARAGIRVTDRTRALEVTTGLSTGSCLRGQARATGGKTASTHSCTWIRIAHRVGSLVRA